MAWTSRAKPGWDMVRTSSTTQRFIADLQGRTANSSTFSDAEFDEAAFEPHLRATG